MEVGFYKDVYHEYMVVDKPTEFQTTVFEEQLLHNKEIPGLLRMKMEYTGNQCKYYYDIGRKLSLENMKESKEFDYSFILQLFERIRTMLSILDNYLLQPESLWLEPEGIYKMNDDTYFLLAYIPGYEKDFKMQLKDLLSWFMKHLDHSQKDTVMFVYGFYKCLSESGSAAAALEKLEDAGSVIKGDERQKDMEPVQQRIKSKELPEENTTQQKTTQQREMITFVTAEDTKKYQVEEDSEKGKISLYFVVAVVMSLGGIVLKDAGIYLVYQLTGIYFQSWVIPVVFFAGALVFGLKGVRTFIDERRKNIKDNDEGEFWQDSQRPDYSRMGHGETTLLAPNMTEDILVLKRAGGDCFEQDVIYVTTTPFIIGTQYEAVNYHLSDNVVSRRHIEIRKEGRQYEVIDLSSTNGTWLNGSKLDSGVAYEIKQSDMLKIANIPFSVDLKVRQ